MSKSLIALTGSRGQVDATTNYISVIGALSGTSISPTSEAPQESPIRFSGTASNLFANVPTNTASVNSVLTLRKSRADTSITITYSSDQTGIKEDTSNTASYANTDEIDYKLAIPTEVNINTLTADVLSFQYEPTDCLSLLGLFTTGTANIFDNNTTTFWVPTGSISSNTSTEANTKYRIRSTFTASNLYGYITNNAHTTTTNIRTRKNGANGNQVITFTAGQTGVVEDTSNTDSLSAGDDFNFSITVGNGTGTNALNLNILGVSLINTSNNFILLDGTTAGVAVNFNSTVYTGCSGFFNFTTTESNIQIYPRFDFTAKELGARVKTNTIATSATSVTVRDNGTDSAITVSYAAAETGLKSDTSNTATITSGTDTIDYKVVTPNTSGAITFSWIGILGGTSSSPAVSTTRRRRQRTIS